MSKSRRNEISEGYSRLLDQWVAKEEYGEPVGCVATTFTFEPALFEEECLSRFLRMQTDAVEDGPLYLVEREEKLSQVMAAVLVDQHNCRGARSLRWDLHSARVKGIMHAKISMLCWSNLVRLIIGSANLTKNGYRSNQEVFGVLDYHKGAEAPRQVMLDVIAYLREVMSASNPGVENKAIDRWYVFLDQVEQKTALWGQTEDEHRRQPLRVFSVLTRPGRADVFQQLHDVWPAGNPPYSARVLSPFFDPPEADNKPAKELWQFMRKRGNATVNYCLAMEDVPGEERLIVKAPATLLSVKPQRDSSKVVLQRLNNMERSLHAKELWLEDDRYILLMIGSSNFTSPGLGVGKTVNYEANLVYIVDTNKVKSGYRNLIKRFPESDVVKVPVQFELAELGEDEAPETVTLPAGFQSAIFRLGDGKSGEIVLMLGDDLRPGWRLFSEDGEPLQNGDEVSWAAKGKPSSFVLPWSGRVPSGIWVTWSGAQGKAWWPVNVESPTDLPPPDDLKELSLEKLISLLSSARPLHEVLRRYLRRQENGVTAIAKRFDDADPLKRVDSRDFLLQRTRRFSWALSSLGKRLERPVPTEACLAWRIQGPVGVMAVARALERDAKSVEEKSFLMAELALELTRVRPAESPGYLSASRIRDELMKTAQDLCKKIDDQTVPDNVHLQMYLNNVLKHIMSNTAGI